VGRRKRLANKLLCWVAQPASRENHQDQQAGYAGNQERFETGASSGAGPPSHKTL
jgi:hypothetical protein